MGPIPYVSDVTIEKQAENETGAYACSCKHIVCPPPGSWIRTGSVWTEWLRLAGVRQPHTHRHTLEVVERTGVYNTVFMLFLCYCFSWQTNIKLHFSLKSRVPHFQLWICIFYLIPREACNCITLYNNLQKIPKTLQFVLLHSLSTPTSLSLHLLKLKYFSQSSTLAPPHHLASSSLHHCQILHLHSCSLVLFVSGIMQKWGSLSRRCGFQSHFLQCSDSVSLTRTHKLRCGFVCMCTLTDSHRFTHEALAFSVCLFLAWPMLSVLLALPGAHLWQNDS